MTTNDLTPNFVKETVEQALERNEYSNHPEPALDIISEPRFFNNNPLYADSFKYFISIGQENCIQRDLSKDELLKMRTAYMKHCKDNHYTNSDFFNEIYALALTNMERNKKRALNSREISELLEKMAKKYDYKNKLYSSKKINFDEIKKNNQNHKASKKTIKLANFYSDQFASIEAKRQVKEYELPKQAERKAYYDTKDKLFTIYKPKFKNSVVYTPPKNKQTKARILTLAATGIAALGITYGANTIIENHNFDNAYQTAISKDISLKDMGLSDSLTTENIKNASLGVDTSGYGQYADLDKTIVDLLESQGTIGLFNDIQEKLNYYNTHEPSRDEMDLFLREMQVLPNAVLNDKVINAYSKTEQGANLRKDAGASLSSKNITNTSESVTHYKVEINDSFTKNSDLSVASYNSDNYTIDSLLGLNKLSKDVMKLIDADGKIDEFVSSFKKLEQSLDDGIITEYDYIEEVGKAFNSGKLQDLITPVENFAARDLTIKNKNNQDSTSFNVTGKISSGDLSSAER